MGRLWKGEIPGTHEPGFKESMLVQEKIPPLLHDGLKGAMHLSVWRMGECNIIVGREPQAMESDPFRWHLTISCLDRHPSWDEIKVARYRLLPPDLTFAMFLPPPMQYVNVEAQDHVFQLWEVHDPGRPWTGM